MIHEPAPKKILCFGSTVCYWTFNSGQSRTIVMIHGFRGTHHGLQKIVDALPDFRIIAPDLPGFGESTPMTKRHHDIAGYSDFVLDFMQKLNIERPCLLGHSFGSIVAASVAAKNPGEIEKLVLINPIARPIAEDSRWLILNTSRLYYWLGSVLPKPAARALLSNSFLVLAVSAAMTKTKDKTLRQEIHQSHLRHFSTFQDPKLLNKIFLISIRESVAQYAAHIKIPTLMIAGGIDNIVMPEGQKNLQNLLPKAKSATIEDVGHLIHHEAPIRATKAIREFLTS